MITLHATSKIEFLIGALLVLLLVQPIELGVTECYLEYFSYLTMKSQGNLLNGPASLEFLPITSDCIGYVRFGRLDCYPAP